MKRALCICGKSSMGDRCSADGGHAVCRNLHLLYAETPMAPNASLPQNPKQAYGDLKTPLGLVPSTAIIYMGQAFKEGARKYGPFNWRDKAVESMTYAHANLRHVFAWIDGEDIDPDSGKPHLALAMASLAIIADCIAVGTLIDTRPVKGKAGELLRELAQPPEKNA